MDPRRIELWGFEYLDPLGKRWTRARYKATREEIAARHSDYHLIGEPEVREVGDPAALTAGHIARGPST